MQYITPAYHLGMPCIVIAFVCLYLSLSSPSSSPVDPDADADAASYDYAADEQPLSAKLSGKQNPLNHSYIAHSFFPMLALDLAIVFDCSYSDA